MKNVKRKKNNQRTINDILLDDYEKTKYMTQNDKRLSMGYGDDPNNDDNVDLETIEGMDDIAYLYGDDKAYLSSLLD